MLLAMVVGRMIVVVRGDGLFALLHIVFSYVVGSCIGRSFVPKS